MERDAAVSLNRELKKQFLFFLILSFCSVDKDCSRSCLIDCVPLQLFSKG